MSNAKVVIQNKKTRQFWGIDGWGNLAVAIRYDNKTVCPEMGEKVRRLIGRKHAN